MWTDCVWIIFTFCSILINFFSISILILKQQSKDRMCFVNAVSANNPRGMPISRYNRSGRILEEFL